MSEEKVIRDYGEFDWRTISDLLDPKPTGVHLTKLQKDMWSQTGVLVERTEEKLGRTYKIRYGKEFVADRIHALIYEPLGIVLPDGTFNEALREEIILFADEYSLNASQREAEAELNKRAIALAQAHGVPLERAKAALIESDRKLKEVLLEEQKELVGSVK